MDRKLTIIPLKATPYSDKFSILSAYSRESGRVSLLLPAGGGREARRRRALLMPLCPVVCVASVSPGREVWPMKEPVPMPPLPLLSADPLRCTLALFLADVLQSVLRQSGPEPPMFDFIADAACRLNDASVSPANFHLAFLVGLLGYLGVAPDLGGFHRGMVFDMVDARFRQSVPMHGHALVDGEALAARRLGRINWSNQHLYKYTRAQRARALDLILEYYSLHVVSLAGVKSIDVLRALFD